MATSEWDGHEQTRPDITEEEALYRRAREEGVGEEDAYRQAVALRHMSEHQRRAEQERRTQEMLHSVVGLDDDMTVPPPPQHDHTGLTVGTANTTTWYPEPQLAGPAWNDTTTIAPGMLHTVQDQPLYTYTSTAYQQIDPEQIKQALREVMKEFFKEDPCFMQWLKAKYATGGGEDAVHTRRTSETPGAVRAGSPGVGQHTAPAATGFSTAALRAGARSAEEFDSPSY